MLWCYCWMFSYLKDHPVTHWPPCILIFLLSSINTKDDSWNIFIILISFLVLCSHVHGEFLFCLLCYDLVFAEHFIISGLFIIHLWIFHNSIVIPWDGHIFGLPTTPNPQFSASDVVLREYKCLLISECAKYN
jgi:hypothetical protein